MADNENNDNKQSYGIAEALTEALEAAVFADCSACYKAYDMIEKYAYGYDPDDESAMNRSNTDEDEASVSMNRTLDMAEFNITGSDGQPRTVYIPKITMMPLPLLHVTEATFDIEMNANIVTVKNTEESKMNPDSTPTPEEVEQTPVVSSNPSTDDQTATGSRPTTNTSAGSRPATYKAASSRGGTRVDGRGSRRKTASENASTPLGAVKATRPTTDGLRRELTVAARRRMLVESRIKSSTVATTGKQMEIGGTTSSSSETNSSTINMKVRVEMKQAELPDGIKLLLQSAANGLAIAARDLSGEPIDDIDTQDGYGEGYPDDYEDIAE